MKICFPVTEFASKATTTTNSRFKFMQTVVGEKVCSGDGSFYKNFHDMCPCGVATTSGLV